jgi:hypothetical protein
LLSQSGLSPHEQYLKVYRFIHDKDRELGSAFNDLRRSTATFQIRVIKNLGVITDEELSRFSEGTQKVLLEEWE